MSAIFSHRHAALALLCVARGPARFGQLCALMNSQGRDHHAEQQVIRALKVLHDLGMTTPAPGGDRRATYQVTTLGEVTAGRLTAAVTAWESFRPKLSSRGGARVQSGGTARLTSEGA